MAARRDTGETHQESTDRHPQMTTNQGVAIADNQNMLRAWNRGPALLEDFIFREKMTHFDHERIPERVVHARGSAAHGYFELTDSLSEYTTARIFTEVGGSRSDNVKAAVRSLLALYEAWDKADRVASCRARLAAW